MDFPVASSGLSRKAVVVVYAELRRDKYPFDTDNEEAVLEVGRAFGG